MLATSPSEAAIPSLGVVVVLGLDYAPKLEDLAVSMPSVLVLSILLDIASWMCIIFTGKPTLEGFLWDWKAGHRGG